VASTVERQRRRRARLCEDGQVEATVAIRADRVDRLRAVAGELNRDRPVALRLVTALAVLRRIRSDLAVGGVARAGVFGSTARGQDRSDSDVDVVLSLAPEADPDPIDLIKLEDRVREAFETEMPGVPVDVSIYQDVRRDVRETVDTEAVYAY